MEITGSESPPDQCPPSPDFHGFGSETDLPSRLVIETEGDGDEEHVVRVTRKRTSRKLHRLRITVDY